MKRRTRPVLRRGASSCRAALYAFAASLALIVGATTTDSVTSIAALVDAGDFKTAHLRITSSLGASNLTEPQRSALEFERERMRRIALDFSLTEREAIARVRKQVPDLTEAEFRAWDAAGLLEGIRIDGKNRYYMEIGRASCRERV